MNMNIQSPNAKSSSALLAIIILSLLALAVITPVAIARVTAVSTDMTTYYQGDTVKITGTASPDAMVSLQVTNPKGTNILLVTAMADSTGSFTRTFKLPADATVGTYTLTASEGGYTSTATFTVKTFVISPLKLNMTVSPIKAEYGVESITIKVIANLDLKAGTLTVTVTQSGATAMPVTMSMVTAREYNGTYTIKSGFDGPATINAKAEDIDGNPGTATMSLTVKTPPAWKSDIDALQTQITTLKSDVATLKSDVATLKSDVATLKSDVSSLNTEVTSLTSQVATLSTMGTMVYAAIGVAIIAIIIAIAAFAKPSKKA